MDPLTHTLFGAALADSGWPRELVARLSRSSGGSSPPKASEARAPEPLAGGSRRPEHQTADLQGPVVATTLIVGANLPDIDFVTYFVDQDLALYLRRGWSHGILAMVVLPLLLALGVTWWARARGRRLEAMGHRGAGASAPGYGALAVLACLGVWSHPCLDWLNTYGVRLLMPFDGRWFYGDVLFIIEPWVWLLLAGGVFLRHSGSWRARLGWLVLAVMMSTAVLAGAPGPLARLAWIAGLVVLLVLRFWASQVVRPPSPWPARAALVGLGAYVALLMVGDEAIERRVRIAWGKEGGQRVEDLMVGPLPANPLRRDVLVATSEAYHFFTWDWRRREKLKPADPASLPRLDRRRAEVEAALGARCVRGMANWLRFPFAEVEEAPKGTTIHLLDARYTRWRTEAFGGTSVRLDGDLRPRCDGP